MPAAAILLDHRGQPLARAPRPPAVRARWDAAQTTDANRRHWAHADGLSADAALTPQVRKILRDRARYECKNNTYASGMLRTRACDVAGTGPRLKLESDDSALDSAVEWAWYRWTRAIDLPRKIRTMLVARDRDGESFGLLHTNRRLADPVKLDLRIYEAEQVASPHGAMPQTPVDGLILDDDGNVAGYILLGEHPGGSSFAGMSGDWELIAAADMLHLLNADRPAQHRGVSAIAPALPLFAILRRFTLATLGAAETAASFAGVLQSPAPPDDEAEALSDDQWFDSIPIEMQSLLTLPSGMMLAQLKAEHPATTYEMFKRQVITEIARCLNMPYNIAAGDSSGYNYASGRLDHQTYFKALRVERTDLEWDVLDRLYDRWFDEARRLPGYLPDIARALTRPPAHSWQWDGHEHVDPKKEADAQARRLESMTTNLADECSKEGKDWEAVLRQRAKEAKLMRELGLTPAALPAPAPDTEEDDDADE